MEIDWHQRRCKKINTNQYDTLQQAGNEVSYNQVITKEIATANSKLAAGTIHPMQQQAAVVGITAAQGYLPAAS